MRSMLVTLVMVMFHFTYSQEFVSINITQQNDLPSNTVYDIFQDSKGFIWVATENGLARYNGVHFKSYENTDIRSQSMSHIIEDHKGRIWLHNFFGEILYFDTGQLNKLFSWEKYYKSGFPSLHQYGDSITINSYEQFFFYNTLDKSWSVLDIKPEKPGEKINIEHHIVTGNNIWVCYFSDEDLFVTSLLEPKRKIHIDISAYRVYKNNWRLIPWNNTILLFDHVNKRLFEIENNQVKDLTEEYSIALTNAREIRVLKDNELAFIGPKGCYIKREGHALQQIASGKNVSCVTKDNEDAYWVGTLNEGLYYLHSLNSTIYSGTFTKLETDVENGRIIAGGYDGSLSLYSVEGDLENLVPANYPKEIQSMLVDYDKNQLLYYGNQLYQLSLDNLKIENAVAITSAKSILKIDESYGLATSGGFYIYNPVNGNRDNLIPALRLSSAVYNRNSNTAWLGTQKGVLKVDMNTRNVSDWMPNDSEYSPGISKAVIDNNFVVLGSYTNGVYILKDDRQFDHLTKENGLISNRITALKINYPWVYIGTDQGLVIYQIESKDLRVINYEKGLIGNEIHDIAITGEDIWVSHVAGLQRFKGYPSINQIAPIIHVNKISSSDSLFDTENERIILPPDKRQLEVQFDVSNNFKSHGKSKIFYRIKGLDNQWSQTSLSAPFVNYLSLPSGEFVFEAYAQNEDKVESSNRIAIPIVVVAPFWETSWFLAIAIFLCMMLVGTIVYARLRAINKRKLALANKLASEQELRIAQLTSIRAQMNPHFIFNTMTLIQSKVISGLKDKASTTINDFSSLMRKVLDFSSRELITLQEEIEVLEKFLSIEKERFENELEYSITIDENLQHELVKIPSLLTQPYVENALRHGLLHKEGKKLLNIDFSLEGSNVLIKINDNGIGREASMEINKSRKRDHKSFAIEAYSKRIALINANRKYKIILNILDNKNQQGKATGTSVIITLPLDDESNKG